MTRTQEIIRLLELKVQSIKLLGEVTGEHIERYIADIGTLLKELDHDAETRTTAQDTAK
jgi:hypothetical protein